MADLEVLARLRDEDWALGRTNAQGGLSLVTVLFDLAPGTRVALYETAVGDAWVLLLVPSGEPYEAECQRTPGCRRVGDFAWGDDAVVDLTAGQIEARRDVPRTDRVRERPFEIPEEPVDRPPRFRAGLGGGYGIWPNLDMACDREGDPPQTSCSVTDGRPLFQGIAEYRPLPELGVGIELGYTPGLRIEQTFAPTEDPLVAVGHAVDVDVLTIGPYGSVGISIAPESQFFAAVGFVWAMNQAEAGTAYTRPPREASEERSESGGRLAARAGLDWWAPGRRWGFRFQGGGMSGESDDLDMQWLGAVQLLLSLDRR